MSLTYEASGRGLLLTDYQGKSHIGRKLQMDEQLSEPFLLTCTLLSPDFDAQDQLGQKITCTWYELVNGKQQEKRSFHGHIVQVNQLSRVDSFDGLFEFEIKLRPWLWLLRFNQKNRIFQKQNLSSILKTIFDDAGFSGSYKLSNLPSVKRPFTMQYNETDFDFVRRLLSEQGVSYSFEHDKGKHTLVFHKVSAPFSEGQVSQFGYGALAKGKMPVIQKWVHQWTVHGASVALSGYDFTTSKAVVGTAKVSAHKIANNRKLVRDQFPADTVSGDFSDLKTDLANVALSRINSGYDLINAESQADELALATTFSLADHPDKKQKGDYAIVRMSHRLDASEQSVQYTNQFCCMPKAGVFAPPPYAKPRILGLQTAIVVGKKAGEPQHDADGNIKIQFHWDTEGGDSPSCYVRVAQTMTGNGAGLQFIPRAGEEVLISYINNDPDQPVVVGSLYNSTHKPPYGEANTTKLGIKTQPSATSNELRFDDKKDNEQFYQRAAKDMLTEVQNDSTLTVTGALTETIEKAISTTTKEDYTLKVEKTLTEKAKEMLLEADSKITLKVGDNRIELSADGIAIKVKELTVSASKDFDASAKNINFNAKNNGNFMTTSNLTLTSKKAAKLEGGPSGLTLSTKGSLAATGNAGVNLKSSTKVALTSSAMIQIKGGIVKIN